MGNPRTTETSKLISKTPTKQQRGRKPLNTKQDGDSSDEENLPPRRHSLRSYKPVQPIDKTPIKVMKSTSRNLNSASKDLTKNLRNLGVNSSKKVVAPKKVQQTFRETESSSSSSSGDSDTENESLIMKPESDSEGESDIDNDAMDLGNDDSASDEIDEFGKPPPRSVKKKTITPMRIAITKTPGGTRSYTKATRMRTNQEAAEKILVKISKSHIPSNEALMQDISNRLHLSEVPTVLPCREQETTELRSFIRKAIDPKRGESSAMYISGVPGTGKTATVRAVASAMENDRKCPQFVYVEVNAMIFRKRVFAEIYQGIEEKNLEIDKKRKVTTSIGSSTARQKLNIMFRKADKNRPPIVILVDELDSLCNRKQDVLYDLFEWTSLPEARVTIIAIANTLDFPERQLIQKVSSRMAKNRLIFQPYSHEEIGRIIKKRIGETKVINDNAIQLASRKIGGLNGDLRHALDLLRRAIRVAIDEKADEVVMDHVNKATKSISEPYRVKLVKSLRLHKFQLFRAVAANLQYKEETFFGDVYKTYSSLSSNYSGIEAVSDSEAYEIMLQLARSSLIILGTGHVGQRRRKVKLGMSTMEADNCIKAVEDLKKF